MLHTQTVSRIISMMISDPTEDHVETFCKLIKTIGKEFEYRMGSNNLVKQYFDQISILSQDKNLQPRFRFMLQDVLAMRSNDWENRRKENDSKATAESKTDSNQEKQFSSNEENEDPSSPKFSAFHRTKSSENRVGETYGRGSPSFTRKVFKIFHCIISEKSNISYLIEKE